MDLTSINSEIARQRIEELVPAVDLSYSYARVERATLMPDGAFETDGEHGVSLAIIATAYAMKYYPQLDPYKVFFYGVMHDVDEFLHGDTPTVGATKELFAQKDAEEAEAAEARAHILRDFPEFNALIDGLADLSVAENAFGKAFDKLAPGYTHSYNEGQVLKERYGIDSFEAMLQSVAMTDEKMLSYATRFVDLIAMRREMHVRVGEQAFKAGSWVDVPLFEM